MSGTKALHQSAAFCMLCESQFTVFSRRHHCRFCFRSVCGSCSPHNIVRKADAQLARACHECYRAEGKRQHSDPSNDPLAENIKIIVHNAVNVRPSKKGHIRNVFVRMTLDGQVKLPVHFVAIVLFITYCYAHYTTLLMAMTMG